MFDFLPIKKQCIHIDNFTRHCHDLDVNIESIHHPNTLYILTHCHSDHLPPRGFPFEVYCTKETKVLLADDTRISSNLDDNIHKVCEENGIDVFDNGHCLGSVSFAYKDSLYLGDVRLSKELVEYLQSKYNLRKQFKNVYIDYQYSHPDVIDDFPTESDSARMLYEFVEKSVVHDHRPVIIVFRHVGSFKLLNDEFMSKFKSVTRYVHQHKKRKLMHLTMSALLGLNTCKFEDAKIFLTVTKAMQLHDLREKIEDLHNVKYINMVIVSSNWFLYRSMDKNKIKNINKVQQIWHKHKLKMFRLFHSSHSSKSEISRFKALFDEGSTEFIHV